MDVNTLSSEERGTYDLLQMSLSAAVPLWMHRLQGYTWDRIKERLDYVVDMIASHGDNILFRSKKKGETAAAFNALAEGMAICSFCPGGVRLFGLHFEGKHPECTPDRTALIKRGLEVLSRLHPQYAAITKEQLRRQGRLP